jgi:hypothetical protein
MLGKSLGRPSRHRLVSTEATTATTFAWRDSGTLAGVGRFDQPLD